MKHRHEDHDDHGGLERDLRVLAARASRRRMLGWLAGASVLPLIGCDPGRSLAAIDGGVLGGGDGGTCGPIPDETGGPYPGDGSNGPNALARSGIVRSDIRPSLTGSTIAQGVPLVLTLSLVDATCTPLSGYAIYAWHCDRDGNYSMYSAAVASETYLRGVQETDENGNATFTTVFPGCYAGRWPHVHFEIYPSLAATTGSADAVKTSQLALPPPSCEAVYATSGYSVSASNLASQSLSTDDVFSDGVSLQVPTMSGSASASMSAALRVGIAI